MRRQSRWDRASCRTLVFGWLGGCPRYTSSSETWTAACSSYTGGQGQHPEFLMSGLLSKTIPIWADTPLWLACPWVTLPGGTPVSRCLLMWTGSWLLVPVGDSQLGHLGEDLKPCTAHQEPTHTFAPPCHACHITSWVLSWFCLTLTALNTSKRMGSTAREWVWIPHVGGQGCEFLHSPYIQDSSRSMATRVHISS